MSFAKVTQDGDEDGCLFLDRLPTKTEAATIRDKLAIPKRVDLGAGSLAALRAHGGAGQFRPRAPASTPTPVHA
jgi:hypothetical protein